MFVSCVHPVAILRAVFCTICTHSSRGVVASASDLVRAGLRFDSHCGQLF